MMALFFFNLFQEEVINIAICQNSSTLLSTLNSKNLNNYTQPAGNLNTSSSETIRNMSSNYNFKNFIDPHWLTWFIGFSEGNGYIGAYNNNQRFAITQKDGALLYDIQEKLNMGLVTFNKDGYYRYVVAKRSDILKLAHLFNGKLYISHRIKQQSLWISILNQQETEEANHIIFKDIPFMPTLNDAWLSGFTDAEGCFNVSLINRKDIQKENTKRVEQIFILDQKNFHNNFIYFSSLFKSGFISLRPYSTQQFRFTINSFKGVALIISYLSNFPLKTNKSLTYHLWVQIYKKIENKEHLTIEGLKKIKIIKKKINIYNSLNKKIGHSLR